MLKKHIKSLLSTINKGTTEMNVEPQAAVLAAPEAIASVDAASLASLQESLSAALAQIASQTAALAAAEVAQKELVSQALATKMAARKTAIVSAVGTDKAESLLEATESLSDANFSVVVGSLAASMTMEASTEMFKEAGHGVVAEAPIHAEDEESGAGKALKKMLAANAAKIK